MDISQHISDLLFNHECVIIPGFGGFVSNYQSATIHPVQHNFHPPSKSILFNKELNKNDGLLVNHIVLRHNLSYKEAMEAIRKFSVQARQTINNGDTFVIQNLGTLKANLDGNIQFAQDFKINYLKDVFGMGTIVSPAVRRKGAKTIRTTQAAFVDRKERKKQTLVPGSVLRIAAVVAVIFVVSFFGFNYYNLGNPQMNLSSFLPFFNNSIEQAQPETNIVVEEPAVELVNSTQGPILSETENSQDALIAEKAIPDETSIETGNVDSGVEDSANDNAIAENIAPEAVPQKVVAPHQRMYHLIAGSFQDPGNAGQLTQTYRAHGYEPTLIGPAENGYYRLSIIAIRQKSDALLELKKVREAFNPNAWLLRQ